MKIGESVNLKKHPDLHDISVARDQACGKHPEGNHCGEVKRGNASTDTKRHPGRPRSQVLKLLPPMAGQVHVLADTSQGLSQHQGRVCTKRFNHLGIELDTKRCLGDFYLEASHHISFCILVCLTLQERSDIQETSPR